jgi:hypothetical protein
MRIDGLLRRDGGRHGVGSTGEGQHPVTQALYHHAVVALNDIAQQALVDVFVA